MAKKEHVKIQTPVFRVSFPAVFAPKKVGDSGKEKYSVSALFRMVPNPKDPNDVVADPVQFQKLKDLATAAAIEKWGADRSTWPAAVIGKDAKTGAPILGAPGSAVQTPFRNGLEKDYDGYGEGVVFVTLSSEYKPGLVDGQLQKIIDPKEFYAGCYAVAKVHAYAWSYMGKHGVSFSLWHLQKQKDGPSFAGGGDASKEFESLPLPSGGAAPSGAAPVPAAAGGGFGL